MSVETIEAAVGIIGGGAILIIGIVILLSITRSQMSEVWKCICSIVTIVGTIVVLVIFFQLIELIVQLMAFAMLGTVLFINALFHDD